MSNQITQLRNNIKKILKEIEDEDQLKKEASVTANIAGYQTPKAFTKSGKHSNDFKKRMAHAAGDNIVVENRYHKLRLDQKRTPNQKIGVGIREIRKQISEIEKFLEWYGKIKAENSMKGENFWKRTNKHIYRIKERLQGIRKNITNLKK